MSVTIAVRLAFELDEPTDILLQFEAAETPGQRIIWSDTKLGQSDHMVRMPAQDGLGERLMLRVDGKYAIDYDVEVEVSREITDLARCERLDPRHLPAEAIQYLFESRYCQAGKFHAFVHAEFGDQDGGQLITAIREWIHSNFSYVPGSSNADTTALESFIERRGVCRDYSHVMIALARACGIPARYCSVYAPAVAPPDFHAVAEVFLAAPGSANGAWYLVDATGMADAREMVKIGVGRDAADVSFMTSFGLANLTYKDVSVTS